MIHKPLPRLTVGLIGLNTVLLGCYLIGTRSIRAKAVEYSEDGLEYSLACADAQGVHAMGRSRDPENLSDMSERLRAEGKLSDDSHCVIKAVIASEDTSL